MNDHLKNVCKIGQGNLCCRYLAGSPLGFECLKANDGQVQTLLDRLTGETRLRSAKEIVDERVASNDMIARGNNCEGKETEFLNTP